jgi:hypothetical protein
MRKFEHTPVDLGYEDLIAETKQSGRTYLTPEGNRYPSITTVLSILSRDSLAAWRARVGEEEANKVSYRASTRGTAVHDIVEKYLDNEEIDRSKYTLDVIQSWLNLMPILDERIGKIFSQETPLYSKYLGVAGRVDCVAEFDGVPSIIDFKTSKKPKKREWVTNYFTQESAYAIMWEERTGMPITNLVTIMDVDGNEPIVFKEHRDTWAPKLLETIDLYHQDQRKRPLS